ncbi:D-2-hydroxyacid dehydrogenase [Persicimonas caeni]|uniref:D-2-hydroxyacid dehydrogenase n=1 Tax=Persicimonas caeni TaxID=2292766 RepID=A0A4Y6PRI8_PERCE|nr:D-2-hydroxyacid dehydrogenase [Persicimonas caeni]QDG50405.1 D-2-hydroxyacid dehydrogenase [Persicimonas caeni]QED31626.1 D-2-hydroxyacid dehydrogenase [Persicimonas caeni]
MKKRPNIVVLDGYTLNPGDVPWSPVEALADLTVYDRTPDDQVLERARHADILLTNKTPVSGELIDQLDRLAFISVLATGYDVVDVEAAKERGIPVSNVPEYGTDSVAQHTFALILELTNHVALHHAAVRKGAWQESGDFCFWRKPVVELAGKTLGIVGLGKIGRRVAQMGHAFGMRVVGSSRSQKDALPYDDFSWLDTNELFATSDVVSLHCPLTDKTERMVDADLLASMKESAFLVNTARGALVDQEALADALRTGELAGAAVDVVDREPIVDANPLLDAPNCIITPHMAWASVEARRRLMRMTADNVEAFLAGEPRNVVNAQ